MADLQKIVYLSAAQYATLVQNGTITVGDVTVNYSQNDLYIVPEQEIPNGGNTGEVLTKASNNDLDTVWANPLNYAENTYNISYLSSAEVTTQNDPYLYEAGYRYLTKFNFTGTVPSSVIQNKFCIGQINGTTIATSEDWIPLNFNGYYNSWTSLTGVLSGLDTCLITIYISSGNLYQLHIYTHIDPSVANLTGNAVTINSVTIKTLF